MLKKFFKKLFQFGLAVFFLLAIFVGYHSFDTSEPDLSDFVVDYPKVSDEENLYYALKDLKEQVDLLYDSEGVLQSGELPDNLETFDAEHKELISKLESALKLNIYLPERLDHSAGVPKYTDWKNVMQTSWLLNVCAYDAVLKDDPDLFYKSALLSKRMISLYEKWPLENISYLVGIATKKRYLNLLSFVYQSDLDLSVEEKQSLLLNLGSEKALLIQSIKEEALTMLPSLEDFFENDLTAMDESDVNQVFKSLSKFPYCFRINKTKVSFLQNSREVIAEIQSLDSPPRQPIRGDFDMHNLYKPNGVGKMVAFMVMPSYQKMFRKMTEVKTANQLLKLQLAIQAFEKEHGKLPNALTELNGLDIKDYFTGEELFYLPGIRVVGSLGMSRKFDGIESIKERIDLVFNRQVDIEMEEFDELFGNEGDSFLDDWILFKTFLFFGNPENENIIVKF